MTATARALALTAETQAHLVEREPNGSLYPRSYLMKGLEEREAPSSGAAGLQSPHQLDKEMLEAGRARAVRGRHRLGRESVRRTGRAMHDRNELQMQHE